MLDAQLFLHPQPYLGEHTRSTALSSAFARNAQRTCQPGNHGNRRAIDAKCTAVACRRIRAIDCLTTVPLAQ